MILFGEIEGGHRDNLCCNRSQVALVQCGSVLVTTRFGPRKLFRSREEYHGSILRTDIVALPVQLRRIVSLPKSDEQISIRNKSRVEQHQHNFGVTRPPAAHLPIGSVWRSSARISGRGHPSSLDLPELALGTPKATHSKTGGFHILRIWWVQAATTDRMGHCDKDRFLPTLECRFRIRTLKQLLQHMAFPCELRRLGEIGLRRPEAAYRISKPKSTISRFESRTVDMAESARRFHRHRHPTCLLGGRQRGLAPARTCHGWQWRHSVRLVRQKSVVT